MKADLLLAEIGSTTTLVFAFDLVDQQLILKAQGVSETTQGETSVLEGLAKAIHHACSEGIEYTQLHLSSSAAGGLSMIVVGLVKDMTVKAASEAALGAGANIKAVVVGKLSEDDLAMIQSTPCNILLLAGGVDYGEKETVLHNATMLARLKPSFPIIYAGNKAVAARVKQIFEHAESEIYVVDNVYPTIDELVVEPVRKKIQQVFERHIIHAKGMSELSSYVVGHIMPTPAAVNTLAALMQPWLKHVMVIDVGGATTDVHSVNPVSLQYKHRQYSVEPEAKRTVEGDLGVFKNRYHLYDSLSFSMYPRSLLDDFEAITLTEERRLLRDELTKHAVKTALLRHVGKIKISYGSTGKTTMIDGKDCTNIDTIVLTGGALLYHQNPETMIKEILDTYQGQYLLPSSDVCIVKDTDYLWSSLGVLSLSYPEEVKAFLKKHYQEDWLCIPN